jgi:hypothetical protein
MLVWLISTAFFSYANSVEEESFASSPYIYYCDTPPTSKEVFIGQIEGVEKIAVVLDSENTGYIWGISCLPGGTECPYGSGLIEVRKETNGAIQLTEYHLDKQISQQTNKQASLPQKKLKTFYGTVHPEEEHITGLWYKDRYSGGIPFRLLKIADYTLIGHVRDFALYTPRLTSHFKDERLMREAVRGEVVSSMLCYNEEEIWEDSYSIAYYSPTFFSFRHTLWRWTEGGPAHGLLDSNVYNVLLVETVLHDVELWDILDENMAVEILSEACLQDLREQEAHYVIEGRIDAFSREQFTSFTIKNKGITIVFGPGQVSFFQAGWFAVTIPFNKLKHVLKYDHPVIQQIVKEENL